MQLRHGIFTWQFVEHVDNEPRSVDKHKASNDNQGGLGHLAFSSSRSFLDALMDEFVTSNQRNKRQKITKQIMDQFVDIGQSTAH